MGKADIITKTYMRENEVFADAFNFMMYNGEHVIDAGKLREVDVTELAVPDSGNESSDTPGNIRRYGKPSEAGAAVQKYRDLLKSCVVMQDGRAAYVLLGIENQTEVHYAMPVRNMVYDALQYARQVTDVSSRHRKGRVESGKTARSRKISRGEYLSGFYMDDKIIPVITLVVHFGADDWDGPLSLYDMLSVEDEKILDFVQNYKIHLSWASRIWRSFTPAFEKCWGTSSIPKIRRNLRSLSVRIRG